MNLKEIELPALCKLRGYLEATSDFIRTGELKWDFEVTLYEYDPSNLDIGRLLKEAYPNFQPENTRITAGSLEEMLKTFKHELGKGLSIIETKRILQPILGMHSGMWQYLDECIDHRRSRFFEIFATDEPNGLMGGILGEFAFVICNDNTHRCLILIGVTVD